MGAQNGSVAPIRMKYILYYEFTSYLMNLPYKILNLLMATARLIGYASFRTLRPSFLVTHSLLTPRAFGTK